MRARLGRGCDPRRRHDLAPSPRCGRRHSAPETVDTASQSVTLKPLSELLDSAPTGWSDTSTGSPNHKGPTAGSGKRRGCDCPLGAPVTAADENFRNHARSDSGSEWLYIREEENNRRTQRQRCASSAQPRRAKWEELATPLTHTHTQRTWAISSRFAPPGVAPWSRWSTASPPPCAKARNDGGSRANTSKVRTPASKMGRTSQTPLARIHTTRFGDFFPFCCTGRWYARVAHHAPPLPPSKKKPRRRTRAKCASRPTPASKMGRNSQTPLTHTHTTHLGTFFQVCATGRCSPGRVGQRHRRRPAESKKRSATHRHTVRRSDERVPGRPLAEQREEQSKKLLPHIHKRAELVLSEPGSAHVAGASLGKNKKSHDDRSSQIKWNLAHLRICVDHLHLQPG